MVDDSYRERLEALLPDICRQFGEGRPITIEGGTTALGHQLYKWFNEIRSIIPIKDRPTLIPEVEITVDDPYYVDRRRFIAGIGHKDLMYLCYSMGIEEREVYAVCTPFTTADYLMLEEKIANGVLLTARLTVKKKGLVYDPIPLLVQVNKEAYVGKPRTMMDLAKEEAPKAPKFTIPVIPSRKRLSKLAYRLG